MQEGQQRGEAWPGKQSRNAPCQCGSGEKYKRCCGSVAGQSKPAADGSAPAAPPSARQHFLQGLHLLQGGQAAAAIPALIAAIQSDAEHFDAHLALGSALMQAGQFAQASAILTRAVALRPESAAAHRDLGAAFDNQNLHEQAIAAFRRAVELAPRLGDVHLRLSQLYAMYSRMTEAADCLDRAADLRPRTANARLYRSDAQLLRGNIPAAEEFARQAVALDPAGEAAHGTLGGLLYAQGRFDEAAAAFETALRINPKSAKCWDGLAHCRTYSGGDDAITGRMHDVLRRGDLQDPDRGTIHFALGKILDDCGEYAGAMAQFDAGNRLRAKGIRFDRAGLTALAENNIRQFTKQFMADQAASGSADERPVFIVGMYRSGTTLVEQIVSSHPAVAAGGELTVWSPGEIDVDAATGAFDPERRRAAVERYLSALEKFGPEAARVTDKLPTNFFRLGAIHALFPSARIVHCRRDPIDTCLSIYSTLFSTPVPYAARKEDLVFCYRLYRRLMAHWREVLPAGALLDVEYEQVVADRDAQTRRLIAFLGLDWHDACLQPERNRRAISTASAWQARQPVYTTSLRRWTRYEPWLGALCDLLVDAG